MYRWSKETSRCRLVLCKKIIQKPCDATTSEAEVALLYAQAVHACVQVATLTVTSWNNLFASDGCPLFLQEDELKVNVLTALQLAAIQVQVEMGSYSRVENQALV